MKQTGRRYGPAPKHAPRPASASALSAAERADRRHQKAAVTTSPRTYTPPKGRPTPARRAH
jgi:hypothetical protein